MARKPRPKNSDFTVGESDFMVGDMVRFIGNAKNEIDVTFHAYPVATHRY